MGYPVLYNGHKISKFHNTTIKEFYILHDRHQIHNKAISNIEEICSFEEKNLKKLF